MTIRSNRAAIHLPGQAPDRAARAPDGTTGRLTHGARPVSGGCFAVHAVCHSLNSACMEVRLRKGTMRVSMEWAIRNMGVPVKQRGSYRRCFPCEFPLLLLDFIPCKRHRMRHAFGTCNFSLILRGSGEYWRLGHKWARSRFVLSSSAPVNPLSTACSHPMAPGMNCS